MNLHINHLYTWVLLIGWVLTDCNLTSLQKLVLKTTLNNASKNKCLSPVCGKLHVVSSQTWTAVLIALRVLLSSRNKFKFAWADIEQVNSINNNASSMENRQVISSKTEVAWIDISVTLTIISNKTELSGEDLSCFRMELMFVWGAPNVFKIGIESITRRENILLIETMTESATFELHVAILRCQTQLSVHACTVPLMNMLDGNNFVIIKTYR